MINRREVLASVTGAAALVAAGCSVSRREAWLLSAATDRAGVHVAMMVNTDGRVRFAAPLPERAHDVLVTPDQKSVFVLARRPGRYIYQLDLETGRVLASTKTQTGRHLYGHGVLTPDGRYLLTSENMLSGGNGVIVVRDVEALNVVRELDSYGIGPHEIRWAVPGQSLIVANGGIATHPDYGRQPLNIETMAPNLAKIDVVSGDLLAQNVPRHPQNSIRHFDVLGTGNAVVGLQQQDAEQGAKPIVAVSSWADPSDNILRSLVVDSGDLRELYGYTASVCVNPSTAKAIVTSPRGDRVSFWDARDGAFIASTRLSDVAGVCFDTATNEFIVSSGRGYLYRFDANRFALKRSLTQRLADFSFDNHLTITHI